MGNASLNLKDQLDQPFQTKRKGCCDQVSLFISKGKSDPSDITCSICFRIFSNPRVMKCKHVYCEDCIGEWGKGSVASCPYCRVEVKRQRGTFGRIDKRTEKKIDKLEFKCRNCCWEGSYFHFLANFEVQPYLDDASLPQQKIKCEDNDSCEQQITEQKPKMPELEKTATKQQQKQEEQQEKQEKLEKQEKQSPKNPEQKVLQNNLTSKALDLFIRTLFELARNGDLNISPIERELFSRSNERM